MITLKKINAVTKASNTGEFQRRINTLCRNARKLFLRPYCVDPAEEDAEEVPDDGEEEEVVDVVETPDELGDRPIIITDFTLDARALIFSFGTCIKPIRNFFRRARFDSRGLVADKVAPFVVEVDESVLEEEGGELSRAANPMGN